MRCIPHLIRLFNDYNINVVTSPFLLRYDSSKFIFVEIDPLARWATFQCNLIIIRPLWSLSNTYLIRVDISLISHLMNHEFDMFYSILTLIQVTSRIFIFIGELPCGRQNIAACRKYLWGSNFFCLYDYSAIKETIE